MKADHVEVATVYFQLTLLRLMYCSYSTYVISLIFIALFLPFISLYRAFSGRAQNYWCDLCYMYSKLFSSFSPSSYAFNCDRIHREIEEKLKDL